MKVVIQRVSHAEVKVDEQLVGSIKQGLLIFCGFEPEDTADTLRKMLSRCMNYRIFSDEQGKMNLSLKATQGGLLLVPQFTLMAETNSGLRPSFSKAAPPEQGADLFSLLCDMAAKAHAPVSTGIFGADMRVSLCNDGPVTFLFNF